MPQDAKECWSQVLYTFSHSLQSSGSSESPDSVKALFGIELVSMVHYIESREKGSESVQSFESHISHEVKHLQCLHSCEFLLESIMACSLSKLVLRLEEIQPSKVEVKKAELIGIDWTFEFGKKIMPKKGSGHVVLIVQRHHFASYLEREWQCSTYDIHIAIVSIGAYDKTGTMTTSQMAVAKLVAMCRRPIILPKFRVDGITYNPLDGVILNWPTDQMDANLQMIARVAAVCKNASITQAKQKDDALGMPTQAASKFVFFFQHLGFADNNQGFAVQVLVHCLGQTIEAGRLMMNSVRKKFKISSSNPNFEDKVVLQGKGNVMN